jgi:DNA polymerase V
VAKIELTDLWGVAGRLAAIGINTPLDLKRGAAIWHDGYRYKKAGVVLLDLHPAAAVQEGLFDKADAPRRVRLMRTVDRLNTRFGRGTVTFAATGRRQPWKLRRELLSPYYATA